MLPALSPDIGEIQILTVPNTSTVVGANFEIVLPFDGKYELIFVGAKVNATAALAAFNVQMNAVDNSTSARLLGVQGSTGVANFDGWIHFALDADRFVPTVDTQTATVPLPRVVLIKPYRLVVTSLSAQAVSFGEIRYAWRRVG